MIDHITGGRHPSQETMRDRIWYVTIDRQDYFQHPNNGHLPNLLRLQEVAQAEGIQVDHIWMRDLSRKRLQDGRLLALFSAGSFPEWFEVSSQLRWAQQLEAYCQQLRTTTVPVLAVCGSHQLVAHAFSSWRAVGHMAPMGEPISTIQEEIVRMESLIPRPRVGEVGTFPFRIPRGMQRDPLFANLPEQLWFVHSHYDQVIPGQHPAFLKLLEVDPDTFYFPRLPDRPANEQDHGHSNPKNADELCQIQALRLVSVDKILYTIQFHPELSSLENPIANEHGAQLIRNFIHIAQKYWRMRSN